MYKPALQLGHQQIDSFLFFCTVKTVHCLWRFPFFPVIWIFSIKCLPISMYSGWSFDGLEVKQDLHLEAYVGE